MGKGKAHRPKDKYYFLAKEQGFRARSAFKLIQLNKKYDFLSKANVLIDLCAAPGGWLQVASKYMPVASMIIGVDLVPIKAIPNVITHAQDITTPKCRSVLKKDMGSHKADVVLHDGAPNVGAAWIKDAYGQSELVLHSLKLATEFLKKNGWFVTKVFRSADYHSLLWVFQQLFRKVEATKPHSSRTASAEIFVVCQGYLAPDRIDPKLLSAAYVFKQLEPARKKLNVLHGKQKQKRHRDGYDEALGQVLHTKVSVARFIDGDDPTRVLSEANQLVFDADSEEYKVHKATTAEVVACCADLRVLGKRDFRGLMKWRALIRRDLKAAREAEEAAAAAAAEAAGEEGGAKTAEEQQALDEALVDVELEDLSAEAAKRAKRARKKARAAHQKQLRRVALGMTRQAVDIQPDPNLFTMSQFHNAEELEEAADVDLSKPNQALARAMQAAVDGVDLDADGSDDDGSDDGAVDSDEEAEAYQQRLEDEVAAYYDSKQKRSAQRTLEAASELNSKSGVRLTRKQRLIEEAKIRESEAMAKLDYQHQQYLKLLAKAGKRDSDGSDGDTSSSDDGFDDDPDAADAADSDDDDDASSGGGAEAAADARADRWFSQPMFAGIEDDVLAEEVTATRAARAAADSDDDDEDEDDDDDSVSVPDESLKRTRRGKRRREQDDGDTAGTQVVGRVGGKKVELEPMPLTEREKRKLKHRKKRAKEEAKAARKRAKNADFEVVAADDDDDDVNMDGDEELTDKQKADRAHKRELIKAGMGRALLGKEDAEFEVVAAPDSDMEDDGHDSTDPRLENYDSDTHAELLALAKKMRRHTTAKALIDASYNRYAFNDDYLPKWFTADERRHFQPQLPITKAEVDHIKANFREIVSRPVAKVAEARARKRRRLMKNLEKARQQARTIQQSEDLTASGKARAIAKAFKRAELKKQATSYVVYRNGRQISRSDAGKGSRVKLVDPRLKADTRGAKRSEARRMGKTGKGRKGKARKGRRKR